MTGVVLGWTVISGSTAVPGSGQAPGIPVVVVGSSLGLASGAMLGATGGLIPCSQTVSGDRCFRLAAAVGGVLGLAGGLMLAAEDRERVEDAWVGAGVGLGAGVLAGLTMKPFAQRVGWDDVLVVGFLGAAIGPVWRGAAVGAGAGMLAGAIGWRVDSDRTFPDALGLTMVGLAVGGIAEWMIRGINAQRGNDIAMMIPMNLRF